MVTSDNVTIATLRAGDTATRRFTVTSGAVDTYADLSNDHNPLHIDTAYAAATPFRKRVAHGLLVAGYVQSALTSLVAPGGVSKSYCFELHAPTFVDSIVDATVTCIETDPATGRASFGLKITDVESDTVLITGQAVVAFKKMASPD